MSTEPDTIQNSKFSKKFIAMVVGIALLLIALGTVAYVVHANNEHTKQVEAQARANAQRVAAEKKKAESKKDLDIDVRSSATGMKLTNNESATLTGCTVRLNSVGGSYGFYTKVDSISSSTVLVPWAEFKKTGAFGAQSFNHDTEAVTRVTIGSCSEQPNRMAMYGN